MPLETGYLSAVVSLAPIGDHLQLHVRSALRFALQKALRFDERLALEKYGCLGDGEGEEEEEHSVGEAKEAEVE
jgi:hypothetical protein